jgi:hypothetical protein
MLIVTPHFESYIFTATGTEVHEAGEYLADYATQVAGIQ